MIRPIIQAPNAVLRIVADMLLDKETMARVVDDLTDTFADTDNCIGLAATQLGLPWRAIIVDTSATRTDPYVMVNPVITRMSEDLQHVNDGCMSINHGQSRVVTKRPKRITVMWTDPTSGQPLKMKFNGLLAACIHHEIDHLDGILFTDRVAAALAKETAR